jgi:hypothetical protein
MIGFLDLPRELRDMVYMALLTVERPKATSFENYFLVSGRYAIAAERPPTTCANFLQCNRQIYSELMAAIRHAKEKRLTNVKLDYEVRPNMRHASYDNHVQWLRIPFVEMTPTIIESTARTRWCTRSTWKERMLGKAQRCSPTDIAGACSACRVTSVLIHQLWVDVRFSGSSYEYRLIEREICEPIWMLCEVLRYILQLGPAAFHDGLRNRTMAIDELVLNVVPVFDGLPEENSTEGQETRNSMRGTQSIAKQLVDVWNRIWAADAQGYHYYLLLQRIKRVRVCINEETYRVRELRLELERGQAENKRIATRLGYYRA